MRFLFLFLFIGTSLFSITERDFPGTQFDHIEYHLSKFLPDRQGTVLLMGADEITVRLVSRSYPLAKIEALGFAVKKSWSSLVTKNKWDGKFDCVFAMHVLERELDRDCQVRLIYDLLKPGCKAVIFVDPHEEQTFDRRIVDFIANSDWRQSISIMPGLDLFEYRKIIKRNGVNILEESDTYYTITYPNAEDFRYGVGNWICNRLDIHPSLRDEFMIDFAKSILVLWGIVHHYLPTHYFVVEKIGLPPSNCGVNQ